MTKLDKVLAYASTFCLAITMVGVGKAKWSGDIDWLYTNFVVAMFFFGVVSMFMSKK